jgi:hypothetical protein
LAGESGYAQAGAWPDEAMERCSPRPLAKRGGKRGRASSESALIFICFSDNSPTLQCVLLFASIKMKGVVVSVPTKNILNAWNSQGDNDIMPRKRRGNGNEKGDIRFSIFREDEIWLDYWNKPSGSPVVSKK